MDASPETVGLTITTHTQTLTQKVFTALQCGVTLRIMTALPHAHVHTLHRKTPLNTQRDLKVSIHGHTQIKRKFKSLHSGNALWSHVIGLQGRTKGGWGVVTGEY